MGKYRVLVTYVEAGMGHIISAEAVANALEKYYPDEVEVIRCNIFTDTNDKLLVKYQQFLIDEVKKSKNIILFIDELHTIIGAGAAEGSADAANILKPSLARGDFQVIGATTLEEYRKYIEKDAALERRFQPVKVGEPSEEDAIEILKGLRDRYEAHHKVKISDEAIEAAVKLSSRYIADRYLPDKAIDLVDEAASKVRLSALTYPNEIKDLEAELEQLESEKTAAISEQDFERAAQLRDEQKNISEQLEKAKSGWEESTKESDHEVSAEDIAAIVSAWTNIPVVELTREESDRLLNMEKILHERVIGQDEAVSAVSRAIRRGRVGIKDPKRPIGSFIFRRRERHASPRYERVHGEAHRVPSGRIPSRLCRL